jgi:hypothetical protein
MPTFQGLCAPSALTFHKLWKVMGTSNLIDPSTAFLFEVPERNSPLVVQELQIGRTGFFGCWLKKIRMRLDIIV